MIQVNGKYGTATIYLSKVESPLISQVINFLNHPMAENSVVKIMPDTHIGAGICIGFTCKLPEDYSSIAPDIIGVDIGCGVLGYNLGKQKKLRLSKLDDFIRENIPFGFNIRNKMTDKNVDGKLLDEVKKISQKIKQEDRYSRYLLSIGTLGGGNHFIELCEDEEKNNWLVIHSGSRSFGFSVCNFYNQNANETINGIKTVTGWLKDEYIMDMYYAQKFAALNRDVMAQVLVEDFFGLNVSDLRKIHSVHNFFNLDDNTIRKGAISAKENEEVIVPFNMKDGSIVGIGKGNKEWNDSAPHGAGRKMGRSAAKKRLCIDDFKREMKGVYTTCVTKKTLDEAPKAYKKINTIMEFLPETIDVNSKLKPVFNFKG